MAATRAPVRTPARPLRQFDDPEAFAAARQAFVDAALVVLSRRSDLDVSVTEVVQEAGLHNAAFYRIFESKDGLLLAVAQEAAERTVPVLESRLKRAHDAPQAVRAWASVLLRLTATDRSAQSIEAFALERHRFLRRFPDAEERLVVPVRRVLVDALVERGIAPGDAQEVTDAAYELVMGQQATWIARGHRPTPREVERVADLATRLLDT
ncbi:MAG: TetR/AcrR family transcriptional regulator [Acidimicrobiia bacterium]